MTVKPHTNVLNDINKIVLI